MYLAILLLRTKFKKDYVSLKSRLETLPNELKYEIMVPISKLGYMPGKLVHTNEILVLLGDNWFVEKSAKQACELVDRRLKSIDAYLTDLNKEKKNFVDHLNWTDNLIKVISYLKMKLNKVTAF